MPEWPPPVGTWTWCPFADEVTWCIAAAGDGAGAGAGCHSCFCCCCAHIVRFCSLFVCWLQLLFSRPMAKSGLIFTSVCPTFVAPTGLWPLLPFPFPIHSSAAPAADSAVSVLCWLVSVLVFILIYAPEVALGSRAISWGGSGGGLFLISEIPFRLALVPFVLACLLLSRPLLFSQALSFLRFF